MYQATPLRQRDRAAIEDEAGERNAVGAFALEQRRAAGELQAAVAADADDLRAVGQMQRAGAIQSRREGERHAYSGAVVDGALQPLGLIVGRAGAQPVLGRIAPGQGLPRRGLGWTRQGGAGEGGSRDGQQAAAVGIHAGAPARQDSVPPLAGALPDRAILPAWLTARQQPLAGEADHAHHDRFAGIDQFLEIDPPPQ
jgi:hypothetical protein